MQSKTDKPPPRGSAKSKPVSCYLQQLCCLYKAAARSVSWTNHFLHLGIHAVLRSYPRPNPGLGILCSLRCWNIMVPNMESSLQFSPASPCQLSHLPALGFTGSETSTWAHGPPSKRPRNSSRPPPYSQNEPVTQHDHPPWDRVLVRESSRESKSRLIQRPM